MYLNLLLIANNKYLNDESFSLIKKLDDCFY